VTLDKVICCYPDMPRLVVTSASKARRLYAIVLPRDCAWVRFGLCVANWVVRRLLRRNFQSFAHPIAEVDRLVAEQGLSLHTVDTGWFWSVRVYRRTRSHRAPAH
jgi:magnesium-protoporphyrin O-methyltransferase